MKIAGKHSAGQESKKCRGWQHSRQPPLSALVRGYALFFFSFMKTFLSMTPLEGPVWKQGLTDLFMLFLPY